LPKDTTVSKRDRLWAEFGKRAIRHSQQTRSLFEKKFAADLEWLTTVLHEDGAISDERFRMLEGLSVNALTMAEAARELGAAARRLGCVDE